MLPSLFISHGSPMLALTPTPAHQFLRELGQTLRPKAIVVVSAHWETPELLISQSAHPETLHDFGGFPAALFAVQYPAPGDPALAATLGKTLGARLVERGMDHGAWVPLSLMYPEARLPVVSLSLPSRWSNAALMELGQRLAHLRSEGILVVGSGSLTHNLHALLPQGSQAPGWVDAFADWAHTHLEKDAREALLTWQTAPHAQRNHPTPEHFQPLLVAMGAGGQGQRLHHSVEHGVLAMDVYAFN